MHWQLVIRSVGLLLVLVGASMAFSLPWALDGTGIAPEERNGFEALLISMGIGIALGALLWWCTRRSPGQIYRKEALAIVGLGWFTCGLLGALPFVLSDVIPSPIAAFFESVSGFTTTGSTVIADLRQVPRTILFWRSFTHWLGGMGIVVLFVALLGQIGAGAKQLLKFEVPGPITEGLRPRIRHTAMALWLIYIGLSAAEAALLLLAGLPIFESLCHTFGTMATGGFSTHNESVGFYYARPAVEGIIVVFMLLAGCDFTLHYAAVRRDWKTILRDTQLRTYLTILVVAVGLIFATLMVHDTHANPWDSLRVAVFNSVSIMTTTGFGTGGELGNFDQWPEFAKAILLLLMFIGGCAGSTGGGVKVIRYVLLWKVIRNEIELAFRPQVVRPLLIGGRPVSPDVGRGVLVYFCCIL
ncbi:MAG: TrkH family potassium uptake protein, partial [Planctomycetes bacterium]|nr:TrkH family potassium uptake protein [Planctomycetota bacterium]